MANCENCIKADVCKNYESKSTIACKHYAEAGMTLEEITKAKEHFQYGISHDIFSEPVTSYAKTAVEALEKLIPQKPILIPLAIETEDGERVSPVQCTACKGFFANNKETKCCPFCGQKLDWGDTE